MEPIFDEEINKAIEDYEQFAISSLVSMKKQKVLSHKVSEWKDYVRKVYEEISDNGRLKVRYSKAIEEASRRRKSNTNLENLNKIRREKVSSNRSKKNSETQTDIGFKPSLVEIYTYKIRKNDDIISESTFQFEDLSTCISDGLIKILDTYMVEVHYELFELPSFKIFYDRCNEDLKNFINSLIYTHFDKIFDEPYRSELDIVDSKYLSSFCTDSLYNFWDLTNSIFKNCKKFFNLVIVNQILIKKI